MKEPRTIRILGYSLEQFRLIIILGCLAAIGPMSIDLYLPAFPLLQTEFSTSPASVSASMASYFAGIAFGQLFYGPLSDAYGRRRPLLVGLILYIAGSLACAAAHTIEALIAARFVQALGGCAGMVICRAVVRDSFPARQLARVFAALMLVMGLAPILAPTVGAFLIRWQGWRPLFLVMTGFALLCVFGTLTVIPHTRSNSPKGFSVTGSLTTFQSLLGHRGFLSYTLAATVVRCGMFAYITGSPFLFQQYYGLDEQQFGLLFGANAAGFVIGSQINHRLVSRYGYDVTCRLALRATCLATLPLLWVAWRGGGDLLVVECSVLLFVASLGFTLPTTTGGSLEEQQERAGSASALMGLMGSVTAALAALGIGFLQKATPMALPLVVGSSSLLAWLVYRWVSPLTRPAGPEPREVGNTFESRVN